MKYLNITSLKKHFENPIFNKIKTYLVVVTNFYERKTFFNYILKKINTKNFNLSKFSKEVKLSNVINAFQSLSLLGGEPLVIIDDVEVFNKQDLVDFTNFIKQNDVNVIIGLQSKLMASSLYNAVEKKGLVFDLTQEKLWEKEKRITNFIVEKCMKAKKNISTLVIESLYDRVGLDLALIDLEIDKLIIYVGKKTAIELVDVQNVCPINMTQSAWQIAEEIVWGQITFDNFYIDISFFHLLLSAVRYQLQIGYKIAALLEKDDSLNLSSYFPKIYPRKLEKKKEIVKSRGISFYKKALKDLFEVDLLSKTVSLELSYLLDLLKTKILYNSSYDTHLIT